MATTPQTMDLNEIPTMELNVCDAIETLERSVHTVSQACLKDEYARMDITTLDRHMARAAKQRLAAYLETHMQVVHEDAYLDPNKRQCTARVVTLSEQDYRLVMSVLKAYAKAGPGTIRVAYPPVFSVTDG